MHISKDMQLLYDKAISDGGLAPADAPSLIRALDALPDAMFLLASRLRERRFGNKVDACSIVNAKSGGCSEDCAFCAQSAHHSANAEYYPLLPEAAILSAAEKAYSHGVRRFCIVTSGRGIDTDADLDRIAGCIRRIKAMGIMPCATLGTLDKGQLTVLRDAGLNRFHHNIETAKGYFKNICTTHDYEERVATLKIAGELGLSLCSGGIMGMGETIEHRAEMAFALKDIGVDSVPLNFLMPIPGTPLEYAKPIAPHEALKTIALFRFILPYKEIRVCGGRLKGLGDLHPMMFLAGANGVLMGDYLTTKGRDYAMDSKMLADLKLVISYG